MIGLVVLIIHLCSLIWFISQWSLWSIMSIIGGILFGDWITGVFHWMEDSYDIRYFDISCYNRLHHVSPTNMLRHSNMQHIILSSLGWGVILLIGYYLGWPFWCMVGLWWSSFGPLIHKWAHQNNNNHMAIKMLQYIGLLQSPDHHHKHHIYTRGHYCITTNYLNPILDKIGFWRKLESIISMLGYYPHLLSDEEIVKECFNRNKLSYTMGFNLQKFDQKFNDK